MVSSSLKSFHFNSVRCSVGVVLDEVVLEEVGHGAAAAKGQGCQDLEVADPLLQVNHPMLVQTWHKTNTYTRE